MSLTAGLGWLNRMPFVRTIRSAAWQPKWSSCAGLAGECGCCGDVVDRGDGGSPCRLQAIRSTGKRDADNLRPRPTLLKISDKLSLRYVKLGEGPSLVLLHTIRTQLQYFRDLAPILAQKYTVYAVDLPGHGHSPINPGYSRDTELGTWTTTFSVDHSDQDIVRGLLSDVCVGEDLTGDVDETRLSGTLGATWTA
jgi:hypothetical protein